MRLIACSKRPALLCTFLWLAPQPSSWAQSSGVLNVLPIERVHVKRGEEVSQKLTLELKPGFHVNSNAPADEYLIPLRLTWGKAPLEAGQIAWPKPEFQHYAFSEKPVSVFSGQFEILTHFKAPSDATPGFAMMNGKLRYQACNDKECLPPKTIDVQFAVDIQ
jgi:thiol:disulfide interchange protein DsbD